MKRKIVLIAGQFQNGREEGGNNLKVENFSFLGHINNATNEVNLHENEEKERPKAPTNFTEKTTERDNPRVVRAKNYIAPNDDCDGTRFLPSSSRGPHQDETLNNNPSISLASEFSQQGNILNRDNEKNEPLPSSSTEVRSETPCRQLNFGALTI